MICPQCESENRADATFCLECGTPLDEESLAELPAPAPKVAPETVSFDLTRIIKPLRWSWPVRLVVLLSLVALLANWVGSSTQQTDRDLYRSAQQAQAEHRWHTAAYLFQQLANKSYFDAAAHLKQVQAQVNSFEGFYGKGSHAEAQGFEVLAAYYYDRANQIEPGYFAVDVTLNRLRRENGRILYRVPEGAPSGASAGLYVMEADGGIALKIPESHADSLVLATSPDGRLVVFDDRHDGTLHLYVKDTRSYDAIPIELPKVEGSGRYPEQLINVALFNSGNDLLIIDGGHFTTSNNEPGQPSAAVAYCVNLSSGQRNYIGLVDAVAYPGYYDKLVHYTDSMGDLHSYDPASDKSSFAFTPAEHLYYMQPLTNDRLLYATSASVTTTLYLATDGQWATPRKLAELFAAEKPYGALQPAIFVSPNDERLFVTLRSRAKGVETHLFDLSGQAEAKDLRDASFPISDQLSLISFSDSGRGMLLKVLAPPLDPQSPPRTSLIAMSESRVEFFFTYPYLDNNSSATVKDAHFLDEDNVYYVVSQNGASREQVIGDIMISLVNYPNTPIKLAQVNTDTLGNWQPVVIMPDQHTLVYGGNASDGQGIYISDSEGQQPLQVMKDAVAFWRLGGQ
ncbi:MAG: hypothetical protein DLM69_02865 [Candidatus Chloroheliales bacterium]|nr:MAG: hypothetical protein DLM69_02865 [Chloroflexota bacterium]